jgi:hypothetical protein
MLAGIQSQVTVSPERQPPGFNSSESNINDGTPCQTINGPESPRLSRNTTLIDEKSEACKLFEKVWALSTEDNNLALYGFRRFKTTHLLNLRLLEEEIDQIDHQIYQTGLRLAEPTSADRLGLKNCQKDEHALRPEEILDRQLVFKLRDLLRQYGRCIPIEQLVQG